MALDLNAWVAHVFGEAVDVREERLIWIDDIRGPDEATALRLIEVFANPASILKPYSDAVLNHAFWEIAGWRAFELIYDDSINLPVRTRLIASTETLFRDVFAVRCKRVLGHLDEPGSTALNSACYMWWDLSRKWPNEDTPLEPAIVSCLLATLRSILKIDHVACQESALHGLGHWRWADSTCIEQIIDEFLNRDVTISQPLSVYASCARTGLIL